MNSVERVKALCKERKIPISKLEKDLGFANGYIGQLKKGSFPDERLIRIADYLNVSFDFLTSGEESQEELLNSKDERDIAKKLNSTLDQLEFNDGLMFDGEALDDETKELLKISLENAIRTAKITAKKKYTPKKYRKDK
ncbi:helix-turn-helix transcriptional regulator [Anaerocolumna sp. AGMB13020]|uniref:helix-turn-helix domain-containing protein n=1 Tax=Anaerocolumna sp. AGMB13020 TaxID=3081750 RepID=UPI002952E01B|nr:helix-turn-helix transcriptional regulator [Anaerocolumna sp. AGMB13020]WOO36052.1 helix-turn-helix transcriptional regulator [Anaerocolumna sp. AGMB13020]